MCSRVHGAVLQPCGCLAIVTVSINRMSIIIHELCGICSKADMPKDTLKLQHQRPMVRTTTEYTLTTAI